MVLIVPPISTLPSMSFPLESLPVVEVTLFLAFSIPDLSRRLTDVERRGPPLLFAINILSPQELRAAQLNSRPQVLNSAPRPPHGSSPVFFPLAPEPGSDSLYSAYRIAFSEFLSVNFPLFNILSLFTFLSPFLLIFPMEIQLTIFPPIPPSLASGYGPSSCSSLRASSFFALHFIFLF